MTCTMRVVSDTSPLLNLAIIGHLALVRQQFGHVWVPPAVLGELQPDAQRPGSLEIREALRVGWLRASDHPQRHQPYRAAKSAGNIAARRAPPQFAHRTSKLPAALEAEQDLGERVLGNRDGVHAPRAADHNVSIPKGRRSYAPDRAGAIEDSFQLGSLFQERLVHARAAPSREDDLYLRQELWSLGQRLTGQWGRDDVHQLGNVVALRGTIDPVAGIVVQDVEGFFHSRVEHSFPAGVEAVRSPI